MKKYAKAWVAGGTMVAGLVALVLTTDADAVVKVIAGITAALNTAGVWYVRNDT